MSAKLGLSLPIGTKVRMVKEHPMGRLRVLRIGDIVTRIDSETDDYMKVRFDHDEQQGYCLSDDEWELIEEKQEPKQGDEIKFGDMAYVRDEEDNDWDENPTVYLGKKGNKHYTLGFSDTLDESGDGEQWYVFAWDEVKKVPNKIELTIEEIEEKLGYEKGSLSIK